MKYDDTIIQKIVDDIDIVEKIKEYIKLEKQGKEYFGMCPFHNENDASFSVTPETKMWYCFGCHTGGNVIQFISKYEKIKFNKVIENYLTENGIEYKELLESSTVQLFKTLNKRKTKDKKIERMILPENIMDKYTNEEIKEWIDEGIGSHILKKHKVRYDKSTNRIVFPVYDDNGNIINIKGRTLYENYKDLGLSKYKYYYKLGTPDFLFGLYNRKDIIKECNEIIIFEAEKSVMKMDTYNILNSAALCTSHISDEQLKLILSLKCNIVIALDKGIDLKTIKKEIKVLSRFTNTFIVMDNENLLNEKDSPIDKGLDIWNKLYINKIRI